MPFSDQNIDDYLVGQLQTELLQKFEASLLSDESLAKRVHNRKAFFGVIDAMGDLEMMDQIKQIHQKEMAGETGAKTINFRRIVLAAAVFIGLCFCIWLLIKPPTFEKLYADYATPFSLSFTNRGNPESEQLAQADYFYKNREFQKALPIFEELYAKDNSQSKIKLAIGICKMQYGDYEAAYQDFKKLADTDFDLYKDHGIWYAALIKLKQEDINATKALLQKLSNKPQSYFYTQATELLAKL